MAVEFDWLIRNGLVYDGTGVPGRAADVGIVGDEVAFVGPAGEAQGRNELDAAGHAVAPGFINMLSWAGDDLIEDGRSQSDIRQGVTLEVMGEGSSMGPITEAMKTEERRKQGEVKYDICWTTLGEYLDYLVRRGVSCNVASFIGATTVRVHEVGYSDRRPTEAELGRMTALVRQAMEEGAMGVASALIYTPGGFADTQELIALARAAAEYDGMYISHIRSESDKLMEAFEELVTITRESGAAAEVYHLKVAGRDNWHKVEALLERIESLRATGVPISADMYTYAASATGLDATMPPWVQEGGHDAWVQRLKDPGVRARVRAEMNQRGTNWENFHAASGGAEGVLLTGFKNERLRGLIGRTLAEAAALRGTSPEDTAMDLVIEDDSRVDCVFFCMSEDNIRKQIRRSWMSFCSDGGSISAEGVFLKRNRHPRTYGSFARLLGRYVREEGIITLEEAVRRLTSLPAGNLKLQWRGRLAPGYFADVVIFDPASIRDLGTYERPHQYAMGVRDVFVNGVPVLREGEHTGAKPGRVVRGPGWRG